MLSCCEENELGIVVGKGKFFPKNNLKKMSNGKWDGRKKFKRKF